VAYFCGSINSKNFQKPMKITQKALSSAQKRQRKLCAERQAKLNKIATPELLVLADKAKEYF
jgi:hypothetical protein